MGELLIFAFAAFVAYAATSGLMKIFARAHNAEALSANGGSKQTASDFTEDPESRFVLGLVENIESQTLLDRSRTDPAFAAELARRRQEIVQAYARGQLTGALRDAFRAHVLPLPGVAAEVEVERVLNAITAADYDRLRVRVAYPIGRIETFWRWVTLPRSQEKMQAAEGPCLMLKSAIPESGTHPELEGRVTGVEGERAELDLGMQHGLGPGDLVEFRREADGEWIGAGVIECARETTSTALWMAEQPPRVNDRAATSLSGDSI